MVLMTITRVLANCQRPTRQILVNSKWIKVLLFFRKGALQWRCIEQKKNEELLSALQAPGNLSFTERLLFRLSTCACMRSLAYRNIFGAPPHLK
jgi:hypothetical protein